MKLVYDIAKCTLTTGGIVFKVNNIVRSVKDGTRSLELKKDVIFPIVNGAYYHLPVMPGHFPKGHWNITGVKYTTEKDFAPVKIITNAHQRLKLWTIDPDGSYGHETGETVEDTGYYFHASWSRTSLGCGIMDSAKSALKLAKMCETALSKGETILLEVV